MESIGVGELGEHAAQYVERAKAGERIVVTEQGEPVAYLVPAEKRSIVDQLIAAGQLKPAVGDIRDLLPVPPPRLAHAR
jgi:prevent-host-death family protein